MWGFDGMRLCRDLRGLNADMYIQVELGDACSSEKVLKAWEIGCGDSRGGWWNT